MPVGIFHIFPELAFPNLPAWYSTHFILDSTLVASGICGNNFIEKKNRFCQFPISIAPQHELFVITKLCCEMLLELIMEFIQSKDL